MWRAEEVGRKISASNAQMISMVMPLIVDSLGGGDVYPVETLATNDFAAKLDTECGIDLWQRLPDGGHRGIASRVQWHYRSWDTFTVRYQLPTGNRTEYDKLKLAVGNPDGRLHPAVTVQAYISGDMHDPGGLLAAGAMRTDDLVGLLDDPAVCTRENADGTTFKVVPWSLVEQRDLWFVRVKSDDAIYDPYATTSAATSEQDLLF
jgi:hypothetical protein